MSVNCTAGYMWSTVPYNGPHNATCSNVSNSGEWEILDGSSCLCKLNKRDYKDNITHNHVEL